VRDFGVKLKLNPVRHVLEGKRVVLIDDSIVRGTTSKKIVRMVRDAGAKEVHMRISCPPTISPCYYGVDTPSKNQLIAANKSVEEIREYIGADSLAYLSLEGLKKAAARTAIRPPTAPPVIRETIPPRSTWKSCCKRFGRAAAPRFVNCSRTTAFIRLIPR
jgi:glutamine phosphoribosylpyrophosphate amidotransferase